MASDDLTGVLARYAKRLEEALEEATQEAKSANELADFLDQQMHETIAERDEARAALAAMQAERDDWKHTANEETRNAERMIAELTAERDRLRSQVGAEVKPAGMTVAPLREWMNNHQRGRVYARAGKIEFAMRDGIGGIAATLSIPQALGVMAAIEACINEAAEQEASDAKG